MSIDIISTLWTRETIRPEWTGGGATTSRKKIFLWKPSFQSQSFVPHNSCHKVDLRKLYTKDTWTWLTRNSECQGTILSIEEAWVQQGRIWQMLLRGQTQDLAGRYYNTTNSKSLMYEPVKKRPPMKVLRFLAVAVTAAPILEDLQKSTVFQKG